MTKIDVKKLKVLFIKSRIYKKRHTGVLIMKKLQISKKVKIALISVLIILIGISSFLLYREVSIPRFEEQKNAVYSYNNKGSINYTVFLKPNTLYEGSTLGEGKLYITEFIDYINTTFNYEFSGERDIDLKGTYDITAKVQGFAGDGKDLKNIWEKNYVIVGQKGFSINSTTKTIKEEVKFNLDPYNTFVAELAEVTKIDSQTMLTLSMNIKIKGTTDKGSIEEILSPSLIIPLETAMFEIGGETIIDKPGAIEEIIQVQLPLNTKQVIIYGIIIGILTLAFILLIFFIKTSPKKDPLEKELNKIFKKHGDRLVALVNDIDIFNARTVRSIDDLVRLADEITKPILYKYSEDYKEINKFYVTDEDDIFVLDLNDLFSDEIIEIVEGNNLSDINEEIKIES